MQGHFWKKIMFIVIDASSRLLKVLKTDFNFIYYFNGRTEIDFCNPWIPQEKELFKPSSKVSKGSEKEL